MTKDQEVGIDFVCKRHPRRILGSFRLDPGTGGVTVVRLADGTRPEDAGRDGKALLLCPSCPNDVQWSQARIEAAMAALVASDIRRVVTRSV